MIGIGTMVAYILEFLVAVFIAYAIFFAGIALIDMAWVGSRWLYRRVREMARRSPTPYEWWRDHNRLPGQDPA